MTATRTLLIASLRLVVVKVCNKATRPETRTNANSCILYFFVLSLHTKHLPACHTFALRYKSQDFGVTERSAFWSFLFTLVQCTFSLDGKEQGENSTNILNATHIPPAPMAFCPLSSTTPYFCLACSCACKTSCQKCYPLQLIGHVSGIDWNITDSFNTVLSVTVFSCCEMFAHCPRGSSGQKPRLSAPCLPVSLLLIALSAPELCTWPSLESYPKQPQAKREWHASAGRCLLC